jgi:hypothetical protein
MANTRVVVTDREPPQYVDRVCFQQLTEVFNLEDQIAALDAAPTGRSSS